MNLTSLETEFAARGFDYLNSTRQLQYVNVAYHRLCEITEELGAPAFPFLEATATGSAPLTVADLRLVKSVRDTTNGTKLLPITQDEAEEIDPSQSGTGNATFYYVTGGNVITTWPSTTTALSVRYVKVPADLASGSDVPVVPSRYHMLIVDLAVLEAMNDDSDENEAAALQGEFDRKAQAMVQSLCYRNLDRAMTSTTVYGASTDW